MKKTGKISALLCGLLLIGISGIYGLPKAYVLYQANSGKVAIHLEEYRMNGEKEVPWETEENVLPGGLISKIPRIVNDGADCYVRAKIVFTSEETSDQPLSADNLEGIGSEWVQDGEYFYCKEVVKSGESVDFFRGIRLPAEWKESPEAENRWQASVRAEAVQAECFFREQLTGYEISAPQGVQIEKNGNQTYADFRAAIPQAQYRKWQLTGMQIPITVTASLPRYWGGGIYKSNSASNFQSICLLTWDASGGTTRKQARADLNIEKVTRNLTIYKKDQETQRTLKGALFSLWAYDGNGYSKKIGNFQDMQDGSYQIKNISYTQTKDGWFLIKEERAPENYKKTYQLANSLDEENYRQYGGREIRMNENGFYSDRVEQPCIFYDEKEEPKAKVYVKKYDIKSRKLLTGAQFQIYPWIQEEEKYSDQALQTLSYNSQKQQYETEKEVIADKANQGKFLIRETKLPQHYCGIWQQEITVTEPGTTTLELEAWNYPERKFTIYKKIRTDELVWAHGNPTFFFKISGKDLNGEEHWYQSVILFTKEMEKQQEYIIGKAEITGIPAGIYQIEELPLTARYILTGVTSEDDNVTVVNTPTDTVNGVQKIRSQVTADLTMEDGSVTFENRKVFFDEYSHDDVEVNHLKVSEEKSSKQ